ncbi:MAG: hypothetical protein LBJ01_03110 [Tannerella sp.]|jgi:hypothetical protein|nr:hypothetical protein [Tannerella sp.]
MMKKKISINAIGRCLITAFALWFATGCEDITPVLTEGKVDIVESLLDIGLKGYAIDSVYTEFEFYRGATSRITGFRKGIIRHENGAVQSIQWSSTSPTVVYGGSYIHYSHEGIQSDIMLNAYGFADDVTNRHSDGSLQSRMVYTYDAAGRLLYVRVERPGLEPVYEAYEYGDDAILIIEEGIVYPIPLSVRDGNSTVKQENAGYICDVLRFGTSPLTRYIIIPDLYYQGIYGTPVKYLPAGMIEVRDSGNGVQSAITRVGNSHFFYH